MQEERNSQHLMCVESHTVACLAACSVLACRQPWWRVSARCSSSERDFSWSSASAAIDSSLEGEEEEERRGGGERGQHLQFTPIQCDAPGLGGTKLSVAPHKPGRGPEEEAAINQQYKSLVLGSKQLLLHLLISLLENPRMFLLTTVAPAGATSLLPLLPPSPPLAARGLLFFTGESSQ